MTHAPTDHIDLAATAAEPELQFRRTIDRGMAHRAAVSEVFVTDVQPSSDRSCLVAVQLPQSHAYYSDHIQEPPLIDVLLVLEACRQAAICGSHASVAIPTGTSMLVDTFSIQLTHLAELVPGYTPLELSIETLYIGDASRSGRIRRGRVEQKLLAHGITVGAHEMDMMFVRGSQHDALRRAQRGSAAPSTVDLALPDLSLMVPPARVGRVHPRNVMLSSPIVKDGTLSATVTPRPDNRGLFDHAYDHLPAMTLTEAARQVALLSLDGGAGAAAGHTHAVGVRSQFMRFAELDAPLVVSTPVHPSGSLTGPTEITSSFEQNGATVAETTVTLIPSDRLAQR